MVLHTTIASAQYLENLLTRKEIPIYAPAYSGSANEVQQQTEIPLEKSDRRLWRPAALITA